MMTRSSIASIGAILLLVGSLVASNTALATSPAYSATWNVGSQESPGSDALVSVIESPCHSRDTEFRIPIAWAHQPLWFTGNYNRTAALKLLLI